MFQNQDRPSACTCEKPERQPNARKNPHPTVKPIALAKYLATLLLPPAEYAPRRLFVPFAGVASECIGAMQAGWEEIDGVEITEEYVPIAQARIEYWKKKGWQTELF
jgi:site-specific DNA-methyltransferase (adenine-specific)